jgi:hypothetical protein
VSGLGFRVKDLGFGFRVYEFGFWVSLTKPETLNPKPEALNPKPETRNPKLETGISAKGSDCTEEPRVFG